MKNIEIFISSAEIELESEREISREVIYELNLHPILFELSPALSNSPFNAYLDMVSECDIFVLVLWKTLRPAVFEEYKKAVERHKPILILLKNLKDGEERDDELKAFIDKFTNGSVSRNIKISSWRYFRSLNEYRNELKQSLTQEISKFYKEPVNTFSREEMYDLGADILKRSQKRLFIFQRTPSLFYVSDSLKDKFLGNNLEYNFQNYEFRFVEELSRWIERHAEFEDVEFSYIFDMNMTREKLAKMRSTKNGDLFIDEFKKKVIHYKEVEKTSNFVFKFTSLDTPVSGPLIIGDSRYAIWILGKEDAVSFSQENEKISDILVRTIKTHTQKVKSYEELMASLNI